MAEHRPSFVTMLKLSHSAEKSLVFCRRGMKRKEEESNNENMMLLSKHSPPGSYLVLSENGLPTDIMCTPFIPARLSQEVVIRLGKLG